MIEFDITEDHHMVVGDDRFIHMTLYEDHDQTLPMDVSGQQLVWFLKTSDKSATILIEKSTEGSPAGIAIEGSYNPDPDLNTQRVVITLYAEDRIAKRPHPVSV